MLPTPTHTHLKFEDFQKSEMVAYQSIEDGVCITNIWVFQNGIAVLVKSKKERVNLNSNDER